ncbi:Uncharacterised protein [Mycobacteroides abscessus subsp. abscessus]|nr:Uncharacterised protein [Mycobacteroides abscessus subsp. abscessus]
MRQVWVSRLSELSSTRFAVTDATAVAKWSP